MALNFTPVNLGGSADRTAGPVDAVPQDIRSDVEDAWQFFSRPDYDESQGLAATFENKSAKLRWVDLASRYAAQRSTVVQGAEDLHIRVSPVRGAPAESLTFRMRTMESENKRKAEAKRIKEAAKAAQDAAKAAQEQSTAKGTKK